MTNNFEEIQKLMDRADGLMQKADDSFRQMSRGGVINTSVGTPNLIRHLKKANSIFKKLDRLSKEGGDSYTDEQVKIIEERAKALTKRYDIYLQLINQANEISKTFLKNTGGMVVGGMKQGVKETFTDLFHRHKKEDNNSKED